MADYPSVSCADVMIWAAAGATTGGGHVFRMAAFADGLKVRGSSAVLFTTPFGADLLSVRRAAQVVAVEQFAAFSDIVGGGSSRWAVVDDYAVSAPAERALRRGADAILVFDDLADRPHDCDLLVDPMPYRCAEDYAALIPSAADRRIGSDYALIAADIVRRRTESIASRMRAPASGPLLATLGLSDNDKAWSMLLDAIARLPSDNAVTVIAPNKRIAARTATVAARRRDLALTCVSPTPTPGPLYASAAAAICPPGVTALELCALGVPLILVETSPHQRALRQALVERKAAVDLAPEADDVAGDIVAAVTGLFADHTARRSVSAAAAAFIDGRGVGRVIDAMALQRACE